MSTPRERQIASIARWLRLFIAPDQLTELRAIGDRVESQRFRGDQLEAMAAKAVTFERTAKGVYFVPNPLKPDTKGAAKDADVLERRWLLVDVDAVRPADVSATEEERQAAWEVLCRCQSVLETAGMSDAIIGDSGNGWHLCQPIQRPNDDAARDWCKLLLQTLHKRCSDERAKVDLRTFNAARVWKLYGTKTGKGLATPERPHRHSKIIEDSQ
jgi:hypothetical protein